MDLHPRSNGMIGFYPIPKQGWHQMFRAWTKKHVNESTKETIEWAGRFFPICMYSIIFIIYLFTYWPFPNYTPTHIIIDCECFITSLRANHRWQERHDPCPLQHIATSFCCRESLQCGTPNHKLSYLRIYTLSKIWEMSNNGIDSSMHCMEFGGAVRDLKTSFFYIYIYILPMKIMWYLQNNDENVCC